MGRKRGAVVIGVNKTGGLQPLESPVAGAEAFATWLAGEGFEVTTITDAAGKVEPKQIADAIAAFVTSGAYHQLVIYFSGHGFWKNDTELWLLSNAPADANAAVSWTETAEIAKDCGIPNVVLISDACRSIPATPQQLRVRGSVVFPNEDIQRQRAKIDKFMAATMGRPAYEIPIGNDGAKESVFTHCFLRAFQAPDPEMIEKITEDGENIEVIPNRRLEKYLQREVGALLASVNITLEQRPDAEVLSDDDVYIGRAHRGQNTYSQRTFELHTLGGGKRAPAVHLQDVATRAIDRLLNNDGHIQPDEMKAIEQLAQTSGFNAAVNDAQNALLVSPPNLETGFVITGTSIDEVVAAKGNCEIRALGDRHSPGVVAVDLPQGAPQSVALRFKNGRGTALAVLPGYIGHVKVDGNTISDISYVPSETSERWLDYQQNRNVLDKLRATIATSVRRGIFRLNERRRFAFLKHIRTGKMLDPVLGLFAVYACADVDQRDDVQSVRTDMEQELAADIFDVAMLARKIRQRTSTRPIVPFCPIMTRGWNLLRAHRIDLPKVLEDAQDDLERALWTTFKPDRMQLILDALKRGEIS